MTNLRDPIGDDVPRPRRAPVPRAPSRPRPPWLLPAAGCALVLALVAAVALWAMYGLTHHPEPDAPARNVAEGRAFARELLVDWATSFEQAEADIRAGKPIKGIHEAHAKRWLEGREHAFNSRFEDELGKIIAKDTPAKDVTGEQRTRYADVMGEIRKGVLEQAR